MPTVKPIEERATVQYQTHISLTTARALEEMRTARGLSRAAVLKAAIETWIGLQRQQQEEQ